MGRSQLPGITAPDGPRAETPSVTSGSPYFLVDETPRVLTEPRGIPGAIEFNGKDLIGGVVVGGAAGMSDPAKAHPRPPQPVGPSGPIHDQAATEEAARRSHEHTGPVDLALEALRRKNLRP